MTVFFFVRKGITLKMMSIAVLMMGQRRGATTATAITSPGLLPREGGERRARREIRVDSISNSGQGAEIEAAAAAMGRG